MTDETTTEQPATNLMRGLLEASILFTARATDPYVTSRPGDKAAADSFAGNAMAGAYAGAAARLLDALESSPDQAIARAVASQLSEWLDFGEPLADWVGDRAAEYGIDIDVLIQQRLRPSSLPPVAQLTAVPGQVDVAALAMPGLTEAERAAFAEADAEPVPVPDSGPGWDRAAIQAVIDLVRADALSDNPGGDREDLAQQLEALLAERDDIRGSIDYWFAMARDRAFERDKVRHEAAAFEAMLATARSELAEVTADRERLREYATTATYHQQRHAEAYREVIRLRGELEQARRLVKEVAQDRDSAQDKVEAFPDRLATARREAAADALEEAANDAHRMLGATGQRALTAADLRARAAEVRSGQRRIEPATTDQPTEEA